MCFGAGASVFFDLHDSCAGCADFLRWVFTASEVAGTPGEHEICLCTCYVPVIFNQPLFEGLFMYLTYLAFLNLVKVRR